tara:strand:- start:6547 stop:9576 length:3030 start_codon:yes stop_codon:yes gene_type:complete
MFTFPFTHMSSADDAYCPAGALLLDGSSDYLTFNTGTPSTADKYTVSMWLKPFELSDTSNAFQTFFSSNVDAAGTPADNAEHFGFDSDGKLVHIHGNLTSSSRGVSGFKTSAAVFRDPTAWGHFVCYRSGATTLYFWNGSALSMTQTTAMDADTVINGSSGYDIVVGGYGVGESSFHVTTTRFEGYLADVILLDGVTISDASDFGETNSSGIWVAKNPSTISSFNTNGFWLGFSDGSQVGKDSSGQNNHFTPTSIGANNIAVDGPVNSTTKEVTVHPCIDPLTLNGGTLSNNNLTYDVGGGSNYGLGNFYVNSGKYYWEVILTHTGFTFGVAGAGTTHTGNGNGSITAMYDAANGQSKVNGSTASYTLAGSHSPADGQRGQVKLNLTDNEIEFGVNNNFGPALSITDTAYTTHFARNSGDSADDGTAVFAAADWTYSLPTGYSALTKTVTGIGNTTQLAILDPAAGGISDRNLRVSGTGSGGEYMHGTLFIPATGDYYFEVQVTGRSGPELVVGITKDGQTNTNFGGVDWAHYLYKDNGKFDDSGSQSSYGGTWQNGNERLGVRLNNGSLFFYLNGTIQNSGTAAKTGITGNYSLFAYDNGASGNEYTFKITPDQWIYAPAGVSSFSTQKLPEPTVTDPSAYFGTILYSGNSTSDTNRTGLTDASGAAWTPDFAWLKGRTGGTATHKLYDSVRGAGNELNPDSTNAQSTYTAGMSAFISGGITVGNGTTGYNESGRTFAVWCLKAGGAPTATNSAGQTPTSNSKFKGGVADNSAYASAGIYPLKASIAAHGGFSILQYTGTGSAATIPHGLDSAPSCIIVKETNSSSYGWQVYFDGVGNTASLSLDVGGSISPSSTYWNDTSPTATLFTVGTSVATNKDESTYIAYCFAKTPGLIGIGKFKGNNSAAGPYIIVDDGASGFKPAWTMFKKTDASGNWFIRDSARNPYNPVNLELYSNSTDGDYSDGNSDVDFVGNGFVIKGAAGGYNSSNNSIVYLSFGESSFSLNNRAR